MQAARGQAPDAPGNISYDDLDSDSKDTAAPGLIRAIHQWAMNGHRFYNHDPVTAQEIPEPDGPLLAIKDNSMTLAFEENIKQLEAKYLEYIGEALEVTPQMQSSMLFM